MAAGSSLTIKGGKALERALKDIDSKVRNRVIGSALKKAAKPIVKAAKAKAPKDSGLLAKSIGTKFKVNKRRGVGYVVIGPTDSKQTKARSKLSGNKAKRNPAHYGHLVEMGTKPHANKYTRVGDQIIPVGSWHPGTGPRPFLRPAFDANKGALVGAVRAELKSAIRKAKAKGY